MKQRIEKQMNRIMMACVLVSAACFQTAQAQEPLTLQGSQAAPPAPEDMAAQRQQMMEARRAMRDRRMAQVEATEDYQQQVTDQLARIEALLQQLVDLQKQALEKKAP
jgi:hypothetical protein